MTEGAAPTLGKRDGAAEVYLLPGEIPLCAWDAVFFASWWRARGGILYLTSDRLVWISWRPALPWTGKTVLISLREIARVATRLVLFAPFFFLAGPFHRQVIITAKDAARYKFSPVATGPGARQVATEITSILREQGLLRD